MKTCDHLLNDDDFASPQRPMRSCGAPAYFTTCDPVDGATCKRHKCRCAKPLPAEERVEALERELKLLRERLGAIARRRRGLRVQLEGQVRGRENDRCLAYKYRQIDAQRLDQAKDRLEKAYATRDNPNLLGRIRSWITGK